MAARRAYPKGEATGRVTPALLVRQHRTAGRCLRSAASLLVCYDAEYTGSLASTISVLSHAFLSSTERFARAKLSSIQRDLIRGEVMASAIDKRAEHGNSTTTDSR